MVLYKLRHTRIFDGRIALLAFAGLVLSISLRQFILLFPIFGCYLALWLALNPRLPVIRAARFGDLSYGLYIYGWPIEQCVVYFSGATAPWWAVFLISALATAAIAFLSWHLIEKRCRWRRRAAAARP